MSIYAIRTIGGKEEILIDAIANKAIENNLQIYSVFRIEEIKNYVFIEGEEEDVLKVVKEIPHVRSFFKNPIDIKEFEKYFEEKVEVKVSVNDEVEIIGGPFKGQKGRVVRVDEIKKEVVLELLETAIPLSLTISMDMIKVIKKHGKE
jgi:transcriptional antiterminator NusG